jgi:phospholipid/cholesterol/gamma-HCH transport system substrate-binding protein
MRAMRERNQVAVAVWGTLLVAAVVLAAVNLDRLPFLHSSTTYHADFANADGLKSDDDVRIEGISVGKVESVRVQGDHVHVSFSVRSGLALGRASRASIEVATVLGNLFLQVESAGSGRLAKGSTIPLARTTVPYSLLGALNAFGEFSQQTNVPRLEQSLRTLASTINGIAPKDVRAALRGLADVSTTLAAKQGEISDLLHSATTIVRTLDRNGGALVSLLTQGDEFLRLLEQRHDLIAQLLADTARLGNELRVLMKRNGAQLTSLFRDLDTVTAVLVKEKKQLQQAIVSLGQFGVNITNITGSGPWLDLLTPTAVVPDNQIVGCGTNPGALTRKPCSP